MASVMTVRGPIAADRLGFTLPHEHVLLDLVQIFPTQLLAFDFQLLDADLQATELELFAQAARSEWPGEPCVVDVTTDTRMGRDPAGLRSISERLDLHLVTGCGRYREPWYEADFERRSTASLADELVAEIETGIGDTDIRPGIIGELGADREFVSPAEERVLRAGARASERTGLAVTLHARNGRVGLEQLDILADEGVSPARVIVGHADTQPYPDYHEAIARRGAWVQFDTVRARFPIVIERRVQYVLEARRRGYLDRVLLSHDVCAQSHLHAYGGSGYDLLPTGFASRLTGAGLSQEELAGLFVDNPRRALAQETAGQAAVGRPPSSSG
jgi:predicted metal-dependent phosphotriesterase family hydrolase